MRNSFASVNQEAAMDLRLPGRLQAGREDAVARVERALERGAEDHRRAALAHEVRGFDPRTRLLHLRGNAAPTGSSTESV